VGFDTEFKTPGYAVTKEDIQNAKAKSLILSYQFYAKSSDGKVWKGICCPDGDERISLAEFMLFVLGSGARLEGLKDLPTKIYLVGHFTRADIPAFSNFDDLTSVISAVRNTFISIDKKIELPMVVGQGEVKLRIFLRDTILLTPQSSRRLKDIGELVGVEKVELSSDRKIYQEKIRNMDVVRRDEWELFKEYALTDAEICVHYLERVMQEYEGVTGKKKVPVTLTGIGIDLLEKHWVDTGLDRLQILGKEIVEDKFYDKSKGYFRTVKSEKDLRLKHYYEALATDCYHGGRNEQYWFGPCFEDEWSDFDLSSAYPTAMSLIGFPDWNDIKPTTKVSDFSPTSLGYALIEFEFPKETRYPTIPVRTGNGLIFPMRGVAECPSPEIYLAAKLGAKITIKHGVIVRSDPGKLIFADFIKQCIQRRNAVGKKTLQGLFWKEISNSTYGKTAQGLRERRVYDLRDRETKRLPPSRITNAYYAAFITSFVRAVLGEIINSIPHDKMIFSCTTDGFLTNITDKQADACTTGVLCSLYRQQRVLLTGDETVLERKHYIKKPLGWRTRGQATLIPGSPISKDNEHILLAKSSIWTKPELEGVEEQNDEIVQLFFNRTPDSLIRIEGKTGMREMVELGADYVEKIISKRLNMEFDWKRRPFSCAQSKMYGHLAFSTEPWHSFDQFVLMRDVFDDFQANNPHCIKTINDITALSIFTETKTVASANEIKYLRKTDGDLQKLRQMLCSAFQKRKCGFKYTNLTNQGFADTLKAAGIHCTKNHVENGRYQEFVSHHVPPTDRVMAALLKLKASFPRLVAEDLLIQLDKSGMMIRLVNNVSCQFTARVT
jgi:hypothetical protein